VISVAARRCRGGVVNSFTCYQLLAFAGECDLNMNGETSIGYAAVRVMLATLLFALVSGCGSDGDVPAGLSHRFGSDYFAAGGDLNLTESVTGDAFLAGGDVAIAGEVDGDLVAVGGDLSVGGRVGDDLYAAGGSVRLDAIVKGSARLAGGDVRIGPATVVAGALSVSGGDIDFDGNTHQYLQVSAGSVRINGVVHGDAEIRADELTFGPDTKIGGRVIYHGPRQPDLPESAVISGGIEFHEYERTRFFSDAGQRFERAAQGVGAMLWFLGVFLAAAFFLLVFPGVSARAADLLGRKPLQSIGLGLAILVCLPFVGLTLLLTVVGIPLALLLMPLYLLLVFLGWVVTAVFIGDKGLSLIHGNSPPSTGWRLTALFLALLALSLILRIPFFGGLLCFVALLGGIGALVWQVWRRREAYVPTVTS
jgi:hypothetical protein